jgi:hypothetical protein
LLRLKESYLPPLDTKYKRLSESEIASKKFSMPARLVESVSKSSKDDLLKEVQKLRESSSDPQLVKVLERVAERIMNESDEPKFKVWRLPVTRINEGDENANKRKYGRKLWENVRDYQREAWQGLAGLSDHPVKDDDPGLFRDQSIVWHDFEVPEDETTCYGYGTFVGPYGHLGEEMVECGGRVGLSTSGFGDVDPITHEVDPDTFQIERLADLVLNPSQGVYGSVECDHGPTDFMKNPQNGAEIAFQRPKPIQENITPKSKIIQEKKMVADAVKEAATPKASPLSKVEEKQFRKYVESFIAEASQIANPLDRLNECAEILECFDAGQAPELREKFEAQVMAEKTRLEEQVAATTAIESELGMDVGKLKENSLKITAEGLALKEQVVDYEKLCEALQEKVQTLTADLRKEKIARIREGREHGKQVEVGASQFVGARSALDEANAKVKDLLARNDRLMEAGAKLQKGNEVLKKRVMEQGKKLDEAAKIISNSKKIKESAGKKITETSNDVAILKAKLSEAVGTLNNLTEKYKAKVDECAKVRKDFEDYKQKIKEDTDISMHVMPRAEERIGKYLDLRENKGQDIDAYWQTLCEKYSPEVMRPFEREIRGAKTLKEATQKFLKHRYDLDPDFSVGQPLDESVVHNRGNRRWLLEAQGAGEGIYDAETADVARINESFEKMMAANGLN